MFYVFESLFSTELLSFIEVLSLRELFLAEEFRLIELSLYLLSLVSENYLAIFLDLII
jgi:hypothetical protein